LGGPNILKIFPPENITNEAVKQEDMVRNIMFDENCADLIP
jgi:hypothetical protein